MAGVSKAALQKKIAEILEGADLSKTSAKKVRQDLEEELNVSLSSRKKEIDELVMEYVNSNDKNGDYDNEEEDEVNDSGKRPASSKKPAKKAKTDDSEDEVSEESADEEDSDEKTGKRFKPKARKLLPKKKRVSGSDSDQDWSKKKSGGGGGGGGGAKRGGGGYIKAMKLTPELADVVGQDTMARHEVVKKIWSIIKERNLYDPKNKQFAICDESLFKVIGIKRFRTFGMMKYLKKHFIS